jgi:hypothetical protein
MPDGRKKFIHAEGIVCPANFTVSENSPYTGIFAPNATSKMFIRLGPAIGIDLKSGLTPGIGFKFMRSGVPSGNFVALVALDPLPNNNYNFFAGNFSNHLPLPSGAAAKLLQVKFEQASQCATQVGLSDIATYTASGEKVATPNFPYRLNLYSYDVQLDSTPKTLDIIFENMISSINIGTTLFQVTAFDNPASFKTGEGVRIGTMTTTDKCTTSAFGDSSFFIQHQSVEEDWAQRPEWLNEIDAGSDCGQKSVSLPGPKYCTQY